MTTDIDETVLCRRVLNVANEPLRVCLNGEIKHFLYTLIKLRSFWSVERVSVSSRKQ